MQDGYDYDNSDERANRLLALIKHWSIEGVELNTVATRALNDAAGRVGALSRDPLVAEFGGMQGFLGKTLHGLARGGELLEAAVSSGVTLANMVDRLRTDLGSLQSECWSANAFRKELAQRSANLGEYIPADGFVNSRFVKLIDTVIEQRDRNKRKVADLERDLAVATKVLEKQNARVAEFEAMSPKPTPDSGT